MTFKALVAAAVIIPLVSLIVVSGGKWVGRWLRRAMIDSFTDAVRDIVTPDIKRMGDSLGASLDQLREESRADHAMVTERIDVQTTRIDILTERIDRIDSTVAQFTPTPPEENPS